MSTMQAPDALSHALAGRYRIDEVLGQGGMATVYRAHDLRHDRDVALKVLRPDLAESLGRERFVREIRLAARLNHPHILPLHDSGEAGGFLYFVMPVMQGDTLRDRLRRDHRLPVEEAVRIAAEVADALDYAHRQDIVHRDIKPENILLHEGHAVVADFGIGKAVAAASDTTTTFTQIGVTVGTPTYMSPEQAAGEPLDGRSDLFSLGCVLYEMLTGDVAFTGPTAQATIARRFTHIPPPVTSARADVPGPVCDAVTRLLEKAVDDRYTTGNQVVASLRSAITPTGTPGGATAPTRVQTDKSIAVLPFTNVNADPDNDFFSDGLTEELITDLARIKALRVISRTSSMQHKGSARGLREIGATLGVRYALTGSVRRAGNALRITAQLVDIQSDAQLWAEKYSGTMDDVFDVQERVSRAIVDALNVTLSPEESHQLGDRPIRDVRAFELFLQARQELRHYSVDRAMPLLTRAIEIEGNVPVLRALRAYALVVQVRSGMHRDLQPLVAAEAEGRALIAEVPDRSYGYAVLGFVCYERGELREGVRSLRKALELDPTDADVVFYLGISLQAAGQSEETYAFSQRELANDPLSAMGNLLVGASSWFVGRALEGLRFLERGVELEPESLIAHWALGYHYALLGRVADAAREVEWLHQRAPLLPYTVQLRSLVTAMNGDQAMALAQLAPLDMSVADGHQTFHVVESYVMAGDLARGLELLETAVDKKFYPYDYYAVYCPFLQPLRGTPAFERILAKAARLVAEFQS